MKELLRRAAPRDVSSVDTAALRRRAQRRQRRHRIAVGGLGVVAVLAIAAAAVGLPRDRDADVADVPEPMTLFCRLDVGEHGSNIVPLVPDIGAATASVGAYRAEFSLEWLPSGKANLRADLYGPAIPGSTPNPRLPDGAILGASSEYDPASRPPSGGPAVRFTMGSPGGVLVTGGCGMEPTSALLRTPVAIGPNAGEVGYLDSKAMAFPNPGEDTSSDGPFEVYDQPEDGAVIAWWFHSVGLRDIGDYPTEAERHAGEATVSTDPPASFDR